MGKLTHESWLQAGLKALDGPGHGAVSVQSLARRLNVTRGSFYHHFATRGDFVDQLMLRWEHDYTIAVLADACSVRDPAARLQRYIVIAARLHPGREVAIRAWAAREPRVQSVLRRVEAQRMAFARDAAEALLSQSAAPAAVEAFARLAYLGFIGMQHAAREGDPQFARFFADLEQVGESVTAKPLRPPNVL